MAKSPNWSDMTAVFGGTFDPPHLGHREAIEGLFTNPGVKRVIVLPAGIPAFKQNTTPAEDRMAMTRMNIGNLPFDLDIDAREILRAERNPSLPSRTFDTLMELRESYSPLCFVVGAELLPTMPHWYRFPELLQLCHWLILNRKGYSAQDTLREWTAGHLIEPVNVQADCGEWRIPRSDTTLRLVPTPAPAISSTEVRERIVRTGTLPGELLHKDVKHFISNRNLYGGNHA